jgi:hypothetical protein
VVYGAGATTGKIRYVQVDWLLDESKRLGKSAAQGIVAKIAVAHESSRAVVMMR